MLLPDLLQYFNGGHKAVIEQAMLALCHRVRSLTRQLPRRTLKGLYQAGFDSLNTKMGRNLLYQWVVLMGSLESRDISKESPGRRNTSDTHILTTYLGVVCR